MPIDPSTAQVLVVEDNPDNLFIVMDLLKMEVGVRYCNARASGRQLFKLLESKPDLVVDLILLDIQIPHEDGYAIIARIRQTATLRATKVVAVTANVMPQDVERARKAGFDGFIGKPIHADRFPEQIRQILDGVEVWEPR
jgi:two-component system cell cycle response regulator DivK